MQPSKCFGAEYTIQGVISLGILPLMRNGFYELRGSTNQAEYLRKCFVQYSPTHAKVMFFREANPHADKLFERSLTMKLSLSNDLTDECWREESMDWLRAAFSTDKLGYLFIEPPAPDSKAAKFREWTYRLFVDLDWKTPILALGISHPNPRWISYEDWHKLIKY